MHQRGNTTTSTTSIMTKVPLRTAGSTRTTTVTTPRNHTGPAQRS
jgi:hypothetical protein